MRKIAIGVAAAVLATGVTALSASAFPAAGGGVPAIQSGDDAYVDLARYYGRGYCCGHVYGRGFYGRHFYGRHFYGRHYGFYGRGYRHRFY
jgi:hypothetical protein